MRGDSVSQEENSNYQNPSEYFSNNDKKFYQDILVENLDMGLAIFYLDEPDVAINSEKKILKFAF